MLVPEWCTEREGSLQSAYEQMPVLPTGIWASHSCPIGLGCQTMDCLKLSISGLCYHCLFGAVQQRTSAGATRLFSSCLHFHNTQFYFSILKVHKCQADFTSEEMDVL